MFVLARGRGDARPGVDDCRPIADQGLRPVGMTENHLPGLSNHKKVAAVRGREAGRWVG